MVAPYWIVLYTSNWVVAPYWIVLYSNLRTRFEGKTFEGKRELCDSQHRMSLHWKRFQTIDIFPGLQYITSLLKNPSGNFDKQFPYSVIFHLHIESILPWTVGVTAESYSKPLDRLTSPGSTLASPLFQSVVYTATQRMELGRTPEENITEKDLEAVVKVSYSFCSDKTMNALMPKNVLNFHILFLADRMNVDYIFGQKHCTNEPLYIQFTLYVCMYVHPPLLLEVT